MLSYEATHLFFPNTPAQLRARASRALTHGEMKAVCGLFSKPNGGIKDLTTVPLQTELVEIASAFYELQEARHKADYDQTETFDRVQVLGYVQRAKEAIAKWKAVKNSPNANAFLAALFLISKWNKFNKE
jgi:hypothetical protein